MICDSTHGHLKLVRVSLSLVATLGDSTFYLGNPFPRLFVCNYVAKIDCRNFC